MQVGSMASTSRVVGSISGSECGSAHSVLPWVSIGLVFLNPAPNIPVTGIQCF